MNTSLSSAVLVVDDEDIVLQVLQAILAKHGLQAELVKTGSDAIRRLMDNRYGCLLVDKNLPDKSGLDVISEARHLQPYCGCVVMTAYPSYESILAAMRMGAVDYLEKPFADLNLVAQKVQSVLKQQWVHFERDAFAETIREMRGKLKQRDELLLQQQTNLEMFQEIVDFRVEEYTEQLRQKVKNLQHENDELRERVIAAEPKTVQ